ncbi:uncharacterized protein K02A2.6-like [Bicyclus anynana]|uniref:Uncharacterized protein K02A2.6-like n=1 Tax=Bicyclus anynana TaxID=110368 RepID=A0ABM3LS24_BICAN|nr:uncharacterized protein K02A2.6-like [Bicyclus anynana]
MHRDVTYFVSRCDACNAHKHANHTTLGIMGQPKNCSRPFEMISIDLVGELPATKNQNTYLFVVVCCFTKYCLLFPIRRATASIIAKILEEKVFHVHGIPYTILSDNGKQLTANILRELYETYKIPNVLFTPKYTPQVNTVERYNKTIMTAVSTFIENDHRSWDTNITKIQFALNSSVNSVTKFTPSFLVYGRELISCGSQYNAIDTYTLDEIVYTPRDDYAENLGALRKIFDKVQSSLLKAHSRNSNNYNSRRKQAEFNVGDIVWKRTYYQSDKEKRFAKKLAPKYIKCRVVNKKSPLVYELEDIKGNFLGTWHIKDIKLTNYKL